MASAAASTSPGHCYSRPICSFWMRVLGRSILKICSAHCVVCCSVPPRCSLLHILKALLSAKFWGSHQGALEKHGCFLRKFVCAGSFLRLLCHRLAILKWHSKSS